MVLMLNEECCQKIDESTLCTHEVPQNPGRASYSLMVLKMLMLTLDYK